MLKNIRQLHLYLGTIFAPLIIFFAFSGALQTLGLHESEKGGGSTPAWIAQIASVHKNQRWQGERRQPPNAANKRPETGASPQEAGEQRPNGGPQEGNQTPSGPSPWPLKWFVVLMSLGLITTTVLGIYMAFKYTKNKAIVWGLLALGTLLPVLLLFI